MKTMTKKIIALFSVAFVLFTALFTSLIGAGTIAYAAGMNETAFEKTDVLDDLQSSENFSLLQYPYDITGLREPEIVTFVEYCYAASPNMRGNYGLYIYIYNPRAVDFVTTSDSNQIMLGVKYGVNGVGDSFVEEYEKFALQFCDKSDGDYYNLFYKFKVVDHKSADGKTIAERVNSNARRYDVVEVELLTEGDKNATAYGVGGTYVFSGYAAGYGLDVNAETTLSCDFDELETIKLDLAGAKDGVDKRTYWRSPSVSSLGKGHQNQINSVFFAVDNAVLEKYGYTLARVKAEWEEYKTLPAVVVQGQELYDALSPWVGVKVTPHMPMSERPEVYLSHNKSYVSTVNPGGPGGIGAGIFESGVWDWTYNIEFNEHYVNGSNQVFYSTEYVETLLPLLFPTGSVPIEDYELTATALQSYCENYTNSYDGGHLTFSGHDFSADLFAPTVDEGRVRGHNEYEFDITNPDDYYDLRSYDSTHNWFQKLSDYGLWATLFGTINTSDEYMDVVPIERVTDSMIASSNLANNLKINSDDVSKFRDYYTACKLANKSVFILRYAFTDYYAVEVSVNAYRGAKVPNGKAEIRQGTQFFDFDIMTLTFEKEGEYTTLGVVASPVDHWTGYSPALRPQSLEWWQIVLAVVGVVLVLWLLWKLLTWILMLPVRGVQAAGKSVKKAIKKNKKE